MILFFVLFCIVLMYTNKLSITIWPVAPVAQRYLVTF